MPYTASSATSQSLSVSGKTLTWVDSRTIKVSEGASVYYLSRDGGDSLSFSGSIVSNVASRGIVGGIAGIAIIVHNIRNDEDRHTVTTGADGSFAVPGAIPGSTYAVSTDTSTIETQVEPANDGEDVGVVTLTDGTYSFKAIPEYPAAAPFLFADGATYTATIRIRNDGTELSPSPFYTLTEPVGMTISSTKVNNLQTIPASGERTFQVSFSVPSITEEWKDFVIGVGLEDSSGKKWADSVSFRFYRDALTLRFASSGWGNAPVVILPDARIVPATWSDFRVPFATTGYKVVMSGATMDTEMKYSIAVETATTDTSAFVSPNSYEPNNGADAASTIGMEQAVVSYLAFNDLDYWSVDTSTPRITSSFGAADWVSNLQFAWLAVPGAGACELQISQDSTFSTSVVDVDLAGTTTSYEQTAALPQPGTWYWRLRAQVAGVWGGWGSRSFSYTMSAPQITSTFSEVDWVANLPFTWLAVPGAAAYALQVSQDSTFATTTVDISLAGSATNYEHTTVLPIAGTWYWRLRAQLDGVWCGWEVRSFGYTLSAPVPTKPAEQATWESQPLLAWSSDARTFQTYEIQVSQNASFTPLLVDVDVVGSAREYELATTLVAEGIWYWRMRAMVDSVWGQWISKTLDYSLLSKVEVAFARTHFLKANGTVWATGYNSQGELGDGTTNDRFNPVQVMTGVQSIVAGGEHTLFLKTDGTVWGTGNNNYGQLGDGTTTTRLTPVQMMTNVQSIATGENHTLFLKIDGTVWATGMNSDGQLGDGTFMSRSTPVQVMAGVQSMAASTLSTLFLKVDGTVWAAGENSDGQLGDGTKISRSTPVQVMAGVQAVAAACYQSFFLKADDTAWATGWNRDGQLGNGTTIDRSTPVQVMAGVQALEAGATLTHFLKNDNTVWATGYNYQGQLGDGTTSNRSTPVQVMTGVQSIANFASHTLFLKIDGTLWATGANDYGQQLDGTTTSRSTPIRIRP